MSINPKLQTTSPDQRVWDAIGDLRREVSRLRRSQAGGIQRAFAEAPGTTVVTSDWTAGDFDEVCSVDVTIPSDQYRVMVSWAAHLDSPSHTSDCYLGFADDTADFTTPVNIALFEHNTAIVFPQLAVPMLPQLPPDQGLVTPGGGLDSTATIWPDNAGFAGYFPYALDAPTVGDHTYSLVGGSGPGGTGHVIDASMWLIVF